MSRSLDRRAFLGSIAALAAGVKASGPDEPLFRISLAEWSLHRPLGSGELDSLDFPATARTAYGLDAVEYVNTFFKDRTRSVPNNSPNASSSGLAARPAYTTSGSMISGTPSACTAPRQAFRSSESSSCSGTRPRR